jgi:hypothetical protein
VKARENGGEGKLPEGAKAEKCSLKTQWRTKFGERACKSQFAEKEGSLKIGISGGHSGNRELVKKGLQIANLQKIES